MGKNSCCSKNKKHHNKCYPKEKTCCCCDDDCYDDCYDDVCYNNENIVICDSVFINLYASEAPANGVQHAGTSMFLVKKDNNVTLQWCEFGGAATDGQVTASPQNFCIPCNMRPFCNQKFVISGHNVNTSTRQNMILCISDNGCITFDFKTPDGEDPNTLPYFDGSSVTWLVFECGYEKVCC